MARQTRLEIRDEVNIKFHDLDVATRRKLSDTCKYFLPYAGSFITKLERDKFVSQNIIKNDISEQEITRGDTAGEIAVVGWGSTFGPITVKGPILTDE